MNKTYKINVPQLTITLSVGLDQIPFNVWRDCNRHFYMSTDTIEATTFTCTSVEGIQRIEQILQGALFEPHPVTD